MKKIVLLVGVVFVVVIFLGLFFVFTSGSSVTSDWEIKASGEQVGYFEEQLIMMYQDGSTSEVTPQWLYHNDRVIEQVEYVLYGIPDEVALVDMQGFQLSYDLIDSDGVTVKQDSIVFDQTNPVSVSGKTMLVSKSCSPFDFVNYTFPDGEYVVSFIPSGSILVDDMETSLPRSFDVMIVVRDERAISIDFN